MHNKLWIGLITRCQYSLLLYSVNILKYDRISKLGRKMVSFHCRTKFSLNKRCWHLAVVTETGIDNSLLNQQFTVFDYRGVFFGTLTRAPHLAAYIMAGGAEKVDTTKLTGLSRIFNAETNFGRANVSFSPELTPMLHNCAQSIVSTIHFIRIFCRWPRQRTPQSACSSCTLRWSRRRSERDSIIW